ncbi:hypothetical protein E4U21_001187 [Claviceps maximensis]|nr:hypothetical protein E4U21_001187 [Claviceps maximensis]
MVAGSDGRGHFPETVDQQGASTVRTGQHSASQCNEVQLGTARPRHKLQRGKAEEIAQKKSTVDRTKPLVSLGRSVGRLTNGLRAAPAEGGDATVGLISRLCGVESQVLAIGSS